MTATDITAAVMARGGLLTKSLRLSAIHRSDGSGPRRQPREVLCAGAFASYIRALPIDVSFGDFVRDSLTRQRPLLSHCLHVMAPAKSDGISQAGPTSCANPPSRKTYRSSSIPRRLISDSFYHPSRAR